MRIKYILTTLIALAFISNSAFAAENIYFHAAKSAKDLYIIDKITKSLNLVSQQTLARADLNNDSIDEFFMRPAKCQNLKRCPVVVIALQRDNPIIIGQLEAVRIIVSNDKKYGVRNLLVAETLRNDFTQTLYQWNPHTYLYEKSTEKTSKK